MPAVGDDDTVLRQQLAEAGRRRPRIEPTVRAELRPHCVHTIGRRVHRLPPHARTRARLGEATDELHGRQPRVGTDETADPRMRGAHIGVDLPHRGGRGEELTEPHRELIERGPDDDGHIGLADPLHRPRCSEAAGHTEIELGGREHPAAQRRRHRQRSGRLGELAELRRCPCQPRAASREDDRALRAGESPRQTIESGLRGDAVRGQRCGRARAGDVGDLTDLERRDIVGDREDHRHPVGQSVLDRRHRGRGRVDPAHRVRAHPDRRGHGDLIDVPRPGPRGGFVPDDEDERHLRLCCLGEGRERVREARPVRRRRCREPNRGAEMRIGGDDRAGLVADRSVGRRGGREQGIEEVGVAVAHESEDLVDVTGQSVGDMRRGVCHDGGLSQLRDMDSDPYVSHATIPLRVPFSNAGPPAARARAATVLTVSNIGHRQFRAKSEALSTEKRRLRNESGKRETIPE